MENSISDLGKKVHKLFTISVLVIMIMSSYYRDTINEYANKCCSCRSVILASHQSANTTVVKVVGKGTLVSAYDVAYVDSS